jgi:hypothetical protein
MTKSTLFAVLTVTITLLSSCGGGWSDEQKDQVKNRCLGNGNYNCDCYLEKVTKAHEDPETYNALTKEEKEELVKDCFQEVEVNEEELESF